MKNLYTVTAIKEDCITVTQKNALLRNNTSANIKVKNPKSLKLCVGSTVTIGFPKKIEAIQGIISLLIPIAFAYTGYFLSPKIAKLANFAPSEKNIFFCTIVAFALACIGIFISSRKNSGIAQFQIISVVE